MKQQTREILARMSDGKMTLPKNYEEVFNMAREYANGMDELQAALFVSEIMDEINAYEMALEDAELLNFDEYEKMGADECWKEYGWGSESRKGSEVLHAAKDGYEVFCNVLNENYDVDGMPCYCCEVYDKDGDVSSWFDATPELAIMGAFVDMVAPDAMRENKNCEDAVNATSYEACMLIAGETHLCDMNPFMVDAVMGIACEYVKAKCKWYGFEWEEYRY